MGSTEANGPAAAGLAAPFVARSASLEMGAGLLQATLAAALHIIPPLIPPPTWNNEPLTCVPMISGHNCFGSVLYPITAADGSMADVTDAMLDGYIASFPTTYVRKVGRTSDEMYKACFSAYMSMKCSSLFPRCSVAQAREEPSLIGGRVPMCLHLCILPLVMCPGFWMEDLLGDCSMVAMPPVCTQAYFQATWRLPPQFSDFDQAHPFPEVCPQVDFDPTIYDVSLPARNP